MSLQPSTFTSSRLSQMCLHLKNDFRLLIGEEWEERGCICINQFPTGKLAQELIDMHASWNNLLWIVIKINIFAKNEKYLTFGINCTASENLIPYMTKLYKSTTRGRLCVIRMKILPELKKMSFCRHYVKIKTSECTVSRVIISWPKG